MKHWVIITALSFSSTILNAQSDSLLLQDLSFSYEDSYPTLNYSYNPSTQTHDYSNNWDFDGDGIKDSLFFTGNGAAHVYFYPTVVLSSTKHQEKFDYLTIDLPRLASISELEILGQQNDPQFMVYDFDYDGKQEIYLSIDQATFSTFPKKYKRQGITSSHLIIDYFKERLIVKDYN